ncbi:methyltransferase [Halalkalibacter kiskunsagensis]|uniref:Methyltransferase n=1 Tax=Halalkalibacter kiskunsagensis TaxID=1548599 RepID=A0ABV6KAJ0_9BACI
MLQVINHFTSNPIRIMDLGCGNRFLAEILLKTYPNTSAILLDRSIKTVNSCTNEQLCGRA